MHVLSRKRSHRELTLVAEKGIYDGLKVYDLVYRLVMDVITEQPGIGHKGLTKLFDVVMILVGRAIVDLDNDSENLLSALINKVDGYIDPKVIDSKNATQELANALLRLGPVISITGNITDEVRGFTLSFSLSAQAGNALNKRPGGSAVSVEVDEMEITGNEGGILQPLVTLLEPYLVNAGAIVFNGVMSNMIANFMHELSLLSSTNLC